MHPTSQHLVPLHGIGSRGDLPLPFSYVVIGAAAALVISFVILFFAWRRPRFATVHGIPLRGLTRVVDHAVVRAIAQLAILALYAWAGLALGAGQDRLTNPAFGFVYVWMWVGLVPLSIVGGQFWRATNPLRTIHRGLCFLARVEPDQGLVTLPRRLGVWPAAFGLFGFGWLELVQPDRTTVSVLRLWAVAWLVVLVLGAVIFGNRWIAAADPFEAYASTVARLSPWQRVEGQIRLGNPLAGLSSWDPPAGSAAVVAVLLGSTAFDSFSNTSGWIQSVQDSALDSIWWTAGGLVTMIAIVAVTFALASMGMARFAPARHRAWDYPRLMAGSVVPIVIGYVVAHYTTLLVLEGQRTAINLSDPLGRGWNVFGSAEMGVNSAIFNHPTAVAVIQLAAVMFGHILGIVIAHEKALLHTGQGQGSASSNRSKRHGTRILLAQLPMLAVMVFYTCSGLLLLFSP